MELDATLKKTNLIGPSTVELMFLHVSKRRIFLCEIEKSLSRAPLAKRKQFYFLSYVIECHITKKVSWAPTGNILLLHTSKDRNFKCEKNESVWGAVEFSFFIFRKGLFFNVEQKTFFFIFQKTFSNAFEGAVSGTYASSFI